MTEPKLVMWIGRVLLRKILFHLNPQYFFPLFIVKVRTDLPIWTHTGLVIKIGSLKPIKVPNFELLSSMKNFLSITLIIAWHLDTEISEILMPIVSHKLKEDYNKVYSLLPFPLPIFIPFCFPRLRTWMIFEFLLFLDCPSKTKYSPESGTW